MADNAKIVCCWKDCAREKVQWGGVYRHWEFKQDDGNMGLKSGWFCKTHKAKPRYPIQDERHDCQGRQNTAEAMLVSEPPPKGIKLKRHRADEIPKAKKDPRIENGLRYMIFVGMRLEVYWPMDEEWYVGEVTGVEGGRAVVTYEDLEKETLNLSEQIYRVLDTPGFSRVELPLEAHTTTAEVATVDAGIQVELPLEVYMTSAEVETVDADIQLALNNQSIIIDNPSQISVVPATQDEAMRAHTAKGTHVDTDPAAFNNEEVMDNPSQISVVPATQHEVPSEDGQENEPRARRRLSKTSTGGGRSTRTNDDEGVNEDEARANEDEENVAEEDNLNDLQVDGVGGKLNDDMIGDLDPIAKTPTPPMSKHPNPRRKFGPWDGTPLGEYCGTYDAHLRAQAPNTQQFVNEEMTYIFAGASDDTKKYLLYLYNLDKESKYESLEEDRIGDEDGDRAA
ncbi:hypothetical protein CYMTET_24929 [Cymbomonas tetramitiformis]|uniref:Uncharacterized protein n=1 Tax=Cymbomonas tetramitiformis TaxID=36881 RepID=A0AAE0FWC5_9CHLO|nr:hypothetical protein CYMTET_24929 [Cymbomonas tetramitiformis]